MVHKLKKYWKDVEIPVYVLIFWSILSLVLMSTNTLTTIIQSILGWVITILAFGYIGYTVKGRTKKVWEGAKAGAFAGVIVGFIGGIMGIIAYYYMPSLYAEAIEQAVELGADRAFMEGMMLISAYLGLITGPLFNGLIGMGLSALGGVANRK